MLNSLYVLLFLLWFLFILLPFLFLLMHRYAFQAYDGWKHNGRNWIVCFHVHFRFLFDVWQVHSILFLSLFMFFYVVALHSTVFSILFVCTYTPNNNNNHSREKNGYIREAASPLWSLSFSCFYRFVLIKSINMVDFMHVFGCMYVCLCTVLLTYSNLILFPTICCASVHEHEHKKQDAWCGER